MKWKKIFLALITSGLLLNADDTLTEINFEQNGKGDYDPNIFVPIYWNSNSYSGIGYISSTKKDISSVNSFSDSKNGAISTRKDVLINWYTYKFNNYSIGFTTNIKKYNNNEFGYIHDTNNTFGKGNNYYVAFDNDIELDIVMTSIYLEYTKKINDLSLRFSTSITPSTKMDVKQETLFKPLINNTGTSSSSKSQDLAYELKFEAYYNTQSFVKLGFIYSYDFMPLKYDIAQLSKDNGNYVFKNSSIDLDEITTKYLVKLYFEKNVLGNLTPTIGFGNIETKIKNSNGQTSNTNESVVSIGFEKRF